LFELADQLPAGALIVAARGPITLSEGSYAWFHVNLSTGKRVINPADAEKSRKLIIQFIEELKSIYTFDSAKVYLCGFSQGAISSYSVGLTRPDLVHAIGILSGRLLDEVKPSIVSPDKLKNLHVFCLSWHNR
jgi:phospholipase/carboxylesterase